MNNSIASRITASVVISLLLLIMNGCTNSDLTKDKVQENRQVVGEQNNQGAAITQETNTSKILESDKIPGWQTIEANIPVGEITEHGSQPINDNKRYSFSIQVPGDWKMISGVLYDAGNKKVAEIPPIVLLKPGQKLVFLDYEPEIESGEELISKDEITITSIHGSKTITKIPTESGVWYPHIYRLIEESYGLTIVFYSKEINKEEQELFNRIMGTLKSDI